MRRRAATEAEWSRKGGTRPITQESRGIAIKGPRVRPQYNDSQAYYHYRGHARRRPRSSQSQSKTTTNTFFCTAIPHVHRGHASKSRSLCIHPTLSHVARDAVNYSGADVVLSFQNDVIESEPSRSQSVQLQRFNMRQRTARAGTLHPRLARGDMHPTNMHLAHARRACIATLHGVESTVFENTSTDQQ